MSRFKHMAEILKIYRTAAGVSQGALSKGIGYKQGQFVSNVERALCSIPQKKFMEAAEYLSIGSDVPVGLIYSEFRKAAIKDFSDGVETYSELAGRR